MGKISKKVLGTTTGKVGDVAFRKWRGLDLVATYAAENPSKTEKQVKQRELMSKVSNTLSKLLCPIRLGYQFNASGTTQWAAALKDNFHIIAPDGEINPRTIVNWQLSKGGLKVPSLTSARITTGAVRVTWNYSSINPCGKNNPSDMVVIAIAHIEPDGLPIEQAVSTGVLRSTGQADVTIPESWGEDPAHFAIWAFAYNPDPEVADASPTEYILGES